MALRLEEYLLADNICRTKTSHLGKEEEFQQWPGPLGALRSPRLWSGTEVLQGFCFLLPGQERHPDKMRPSPSASRLRTAEGIALLANHRDFCSSFPGHDTEAQGTWELQPLGSPSTLLPLPHQACGSGSPAACPFSPLPPEAKSQEPPKSCCSVERPQQRATNI